ncbi:hypothetical protein ACHAPT_000480 [Fusarium lateritium]
MSNPGDPAESETQPDPDQQVSLVMPMQIGSPNGESPRRREAVCTRTTFFVNVDWRMGSTLATAANIVGQIPGWASHFLREGFQVFLVDMPPSGRSNFLTSSHYLHRDVGLKSYSISAPFVESELTAPEVVTADNPRIKYDYAVFHDKWPGTGLRGDPIFANYCASLATLHLTKVERQSLAQNALQALLKHAGKSWLIGEGTGANMAWLANDVEPDLLAGVIAIEPAGPPFGTANPKDGNRPRTYTQWIQRDEHTRPYGLTDLPLTYDPPAFPFEGFGDGIGDALDIEMRMRPDGMGACLMQRRLDEFDDTVPDEDAVAQPHNVRQLMNLKKVPHALVTAHASSHVMYDWATVSFMVQAGVSVSWLKLEDHQIYGNGHLMFLETNSDEIARLLTRWIYTHSAPETFNGMVQDPITPPRTRLAFDSSERPSTGQSTARIQSVRRADSAERAQQKTIHSSGQSSGYQASAEHSSSSQPTHTPEHFVQSSPGNEPTYSLESLPSLQSEDSQESYEETQSIQTPHQSVYRSSDDSSYVPSSGYLASAESAAVSQRSRTPQSSSETAHIQSSGSQASGGGPVTSHEVQTPQHATQEYSEYSQGLPSGHAPSTNKRPADSVASSTHGQGSSEHPGRTWGQGLKRPRMAPSPPPPTSSPPIPWTTPRQSDEIARRYVEETTGVPLDGLAMIRPSYPGPAQLRPAGLVTAFPSSPLGYTPKPSARSTSLYEHLAAGSQSNYSSRGSQSSATRGYTHLGAHFECQPGTAEESIAIGMANQGRFAPDPSYAATADQPYFWPIPPTQDLNGGLLNQPAPMSYGGDFTQATFAPPAVEPYPARPSTPLPPNSAEEDNFYDLFTNIPRESPPSPSPAPRMSSNGALSNVGTGSPTRTGSGRESSSK